jgi:hypothetical protein
VTGKKLPQGALDVPFTKEHESEKSVEQLPEQRARPNNIAKRFFDGVVLHDLFLSFLFPDFKP